MGASGGMVPALHDWTKRRTRAIAPGSGKRCASSDSTAAKNWSRRLGPVEVGAAVEKTMGFRLLLLVVVLLLAVWLCVVCVCVGGGGV
jgi:hypothetical protein